MAGWRITGVAVFGWLSMTVAAETYRVSGIVQPDNGEASALIEMPDGSSRVVRSGDRVGDARLVEISYPEVVLESDAGGRQVLKLEGSAVAAARNAPPPVATDADSGYEHAPPPERTQHEMTVEAVPALLEAGTIRGLTDLHKRAAGKDASEVSAALNAQLGLEAGEMIVQVNQQPVASPAEALEAINATLSEPVPLVMNVNGSRGVRRLYLMPEQSFSQSQSPATQ